MLVIMKDASFRRDDLESLFVIVYHSPPRDPSIPTGHLDHRQETTSRLSSAKLSDPFVAIVKRTGLRPPKPRMRVRIPLATPHTKDTSRNVLNSNHSLPSWASCASIDALSPFRIRSSSGRRTLFGMYESNGFIEIAYYIIVTISMVPGPLEVQFHVNSPQCKAIGMRRFFQPMHP